MWTDRRLCNLLGVEHPIIQAPMAGSATPALAAAVANAGGLGSLGCADMSVAEFRAALAETRASTDRPININFFAHPPPRHDADDLARAKGARAPLYAAIGISEVPDWRPTINSFDATMLEAVLDARPEIASFHFRLPNAESMRALKLRGAVILSTATTVAEARDLEARGADAVIAQGWEAGGHQGFI